MTLFLGGKCHGALLEFPKCSFVTWLAFRKKLCTLDKLKSSGFALANIYYICYADAENIEHVLFNCCYSRRTKVIGDSRGWANNSTWDHWISWATSTLVCEKKKLKWERLCFNITIHCLWQERNIRCHSRPAFTSASDLAKKILDRTNEFIILKAQVVLLRFSTLCLF